MKHSFFSNYDPKKEFRISIKMLLAVMSQSESIYSVRLPHKKSPERELIVLLQSINITFYAVYELQFPDENCFSDNKTSHGLCKNL